MENLHLSNKTLTIIGVAISFTLWGGIFALPILGLAQIIMSIYIFKHKTKLTKKSKNLFFTYLIITPVLALTFKLISILTNIETLLILFIWMIVSSLLALFHLYITYRINKNV